ncbi:glycoside hydrolase family 125 protein [Devriesea agamarum]|uniref:glycoside hydrolase family 125 protein n=1 Tax=Devriesea agamarum TaxID=472569 RepID=UPI00071C33A3|nr:glycoside hydrolase family 125 protein [Devriesea agamarum]
MVQLNVDLLDEVRDRVSEVTGSEEIAHRVVSYLRNTTETTVTVDEDGTTFVITGDIPAMWLRDSAAQLRPLLYLAQGRPEIQQLIGGLLRRHWQYIALDPYANAFNRTADGKHWDDDDTDVVSDWIWERKFELDSLSYGLDLAHALWRATEYTGFVDENFRVAAQNILTVIEREQDHEERSQYYFRRAGVPAQDTLSRDGRGSLVVPTGMVWSGFRPSDDACELGYNVPGNFYLARALDALVQIATEVLKDEELAAQARVKSREIRGGLAAHAMVDGPGGETILAYEVDGQGAHVVMDDANVPSLLSLPYLGCIDIEDPVYSATRRVVLSSHNPYYYQGEQLQGVGSPHTPPDHVWPIALAIQGLTSTDAEEQRRLLDLMMATDGGTGMMHEGVHVNEPATFTREWFSWSNMMFTELALVHAGFRIPGVSPAYQPHA